MYTKKCFQAPQKEKDFRAQPEKRRGYKCTGRTSHQQTRATSINTLERKQYLLLAHRASAPAVGSWAQTHSSPTGQHSSWEQHSHTRAHTCTRTHIRHQLPPLYIRRLGCFCKAYLMIHASSQSYTVPLWSGEMWVYSGTETTCPNFHLVIMSSSEKWKSITENQVSWNMLNELFCIK